MQLNATPTRFPNTMHRGREMSCFKAMILLLKKASESSPASRRVQRSACPTGSADTAELLGHRRRESLPATVARRFGWWGFVGRVSPRRLRQDLALSSRLILLGGDRDRDCLHHGELSS